MKKYIILFTLLISLLAACTPNGEGGEPTSTAPRLLRIQYTAASQAWLQDFYDCAKSRSDILLTSELRSASDLDLRSADLLLRLGEPANSPANTFQVGREDLLVATHRQSPLQNMDQANVQAVFGGQLDSQVQVWVYASGEDVQQAFVESVLGGAAVTSNARLAAGPQEMSDAINGRENAVGVLPAHWMAGSSRYIFTLPGVPVLAMTGESPSAMTLDLVACVQEKNGNPGN